MDQWEASITCRMIGGSGFTVTVSVAYLDLTGAMPGAAPTWHWNLKQKDQDAAT